MNWLTAHPYTLAISGIVIVVLGGVFIQVRTSSQAYEPQTVAWGGGGFLSSPIPTIPGISNTGRENIYSAVQNGAPFYYDPSALLSTPEEGTADFDFDTFLATLSRSGKSSASAQSTDSSLDVYSFIPSGLISTSTHEKVLTATQKALYDYGNEVGEYVQSFESAFRNAPQILKDQFEDRKNPAKNAALTELAEGLKNVGDDLAAMSDVPSEINSAHTQVAKSYQEIGSKLARIPDAKNEQELLELILAYNDSAEVYVKNFVTLATLFSAHGVTFSSEDSGSIFTFTSGSL